MQKLRQLLTTTTILGLSFFGLSAQADESLGIGVQIVESSQGDLSMGNRAWFGIEPGERGTAVFKVVSQSNLDQTITYEVFDKEIVNGTSQADTSELSETAQWLSFEPAVAIVPAGGSREITMTYDIPTDAPEEAFDAVLRVLATGEDSSEEVQAGSKAVVGAAVGMDIDVWLGIGNAVSLLPNFDIRDVQGVILPQGRFLRVEFENLGVVPLALRGSVQLADPVLVERSFEPITYAARIIQSGDRGYVDVPVAEEVTDGNWNVFVSATQAQVRQTRLFEKEIVFAAPSEGGIPWGLIQSVLIGLFALLAVYGLRKIVRPSAKSEAKIKKTSRVFSLIRSLRLPRFSFPRIELKLSKLPMIPKLPKRESKPVEQKQQSSASRYSENRAWANTKAKSKPLSETAGYEPPAKVEVDEEQLEQAIQRALLKVLENTAKTHEQDTEEKKPKPKPKPRKKPK